ncbi:hypothetical protein [Lentzea sp. NPDC003310]|uniref:hypothetical protein n=1 Tax=Lentzea sp. NPDC003310 TaxID=3154447 RepID=UPI0033B2E939
MLTTEEIELVRRGCDELDDTARSAFAVDAALKALGRDLVELEESDAGLAVSAALTAWRTPSADEAVVSETRLAELYQQQLRDLEELRAADPADPADTYRKVLHRSEREGMPYLNGMEALLAPEGR